MKWFYTLRNSVKGPYTTQEFENALNHLGTDISGSLVWTRGKSEWLPAERWTPADGLQAKPLPAPKVNADNTLKLSGEKLDLNAVPELKLEDTIEASESNIIPDNFNFEPAPTPSTTKATPVTKPMTPKSPLVPKCSTGAVRAA